MHCSFEIDTFLELSSGIAAWASACLGMFSKKKKKKFTTFQEQVHLLNYVIM